MANYNLPSEKTSSLTLDRGLYALRYASAGTGAPPVIDIEPGPGSGSIVEIVLAPGETAPRLFAPGTACVLVSNGRSTVDLTVRASDGGTTEASLRLESLHDTTRARNLAHRLPRDRGAAVSRAAAQRAALRHPRAALPSIDWR